MLRLCPPQTHIGGLRKSSLKLGFRLVEVRQRRGPAVVKVLSQLQGARVVGSRPIEKVLLSVLASQSEVSTRELRVDTEIECGEIGGTRLLARARRRHGVTNAAPDVGLVRNVRIQREVVEIARPAAVEVRRV